MQLRRVCPPDNQAPEAWLSRYDSGPAVVMDWPASSRLAVVQVRLTDRQSTAEVVLSRAALGEALAEAFGETSEHATSCPTLFFTVPRSILFAPGVCPGLREEEFEQ